MPAEPECASSVESIMACMICSSFPTCPARGLSHSKGTEHISYFEDILTDEKHPSAALLRCAFRVRVSGVGCRFRILGLGLEVWGLGFGVWGLGCRFGMSGLGFRVSCFVFRVLGLGFRVAHPSFGFRVSDSGSRVAGRGFAVWGRDVIRFVLLFSRESHERLQEPGFGGV